jgi:CRISPR-associated protein Csy1
MKTNADQVRALRTVMQDFVQTRLATKLEKLQEDDPKRQALIEAHQLKAWLGDAAKRVGQIQLASHTLKNIHPDARGSQIYVQDYPCKDDTLIASHTLGKDAALDVVGNAAALDVYKFLRASLDGQSLLARLLAEDVNVEAALSGDEVSPEGDTEKQVAAKTLADCFRGIANAKQIAASDSLAKQVYFPVDDGYHLLAPLYPTSLVHVLHGQIREDRFSDATKAARKARWDQVAHSEGYREHADVLVQSFGGTKPQNISQLNSERGGEAYLLASLPPVWRDQDTVVPLGVASVFAMAIGTFARREFVREKTAELRKFLVEVIAKNNFDIRDHRAELVNEIIDELFAFSAAVRALPAGWSLNPKCKLSTAECDWLDPGRAAVLARQKAEIVPSAADLAIAAFNSNLAPADPGPSEAEEVKPWAKDVAQRFALWLNAAISTKKTEMDEVEARFWANLVEPRLRQLAEELSDA